MGDDIFVFVAGNIGHDRIEDFQDGDLLRLFRFGASLDSFEDVQTRSTQTAQGVLIDLGLNASVLIANRTVESLSADDFLFV